MENVLLIGVKRPFEKSWEVEEYLDELMMLAENLGYRGKFRLVQNRQTPDNATFVGSGMVEKINQLVTNESLKAVIFDDELSPAQQNNLEKMISVPVFDRTFVILSIFSERAKTKEAKAQVDLARLKYEYPRLKKMWAHLHRQVGGIGTRGGEGEKQLEVDRRIARRQMEKLDRELERFKVGRATRKKQRRNMLGISLVGYTNAGKSTLMNSLTKANVEADDRLFVTLDATSRLWVVDPVMRVALSDTVGFIRKLPHDLVASFRGTLSEVQDSDLLFHVIDACHPHWEELVQAVEDVIDSITEEPIPTVKIFNKIDQLPEIELKSLRRNYPDALFLSALTKEGVEELKAFVIETFSDLIQTMSFRLPLSEAHHFHKISEFGHIQNSEHRDEGILFSIRGFKDRLGTLTRQMPELEPVASDQLQTEWA
ncbi:MAG: GTPase HflX [Acidobacteria bacterium]|nr:GTPase HflX [Acidobacteriota bacterium]